MQKFPKILRYIFSVLACHAMLASCGSETTLYRYDRLVVTPINLATGAPIDATSSELERQSLSLECRFVWHSLGSEKSTALGRVAQKNMVLNEKVDSVFVTAISELSSEKDSVINKICTEGTGFGSLRAYALASVSASSDPLIKFSVVLNEKLPYNRQKLAVQVMLEDGRVLSDTTDFYIKTNE